MKPKLRGVLELQYGKEEVIFHTKNMSITIPDLDTFLYEYEHKDSGYMIYMEDKYLKAVNDYLVRTHPEYHSLVRVYNKEKGFTFKGYKLESYNKSFYSMKYKSGTDELSTKDFLKIIDDIPSGTKEGYTSVLKKQTEFVKEPFLDFTTGETQPSLCPMLYAKTNKEFVHVKCYDITSFYPYLLTQELPMFEKFIDREEMDLDNKNFTYYGRITVKKLKAKNPSFCPLTLVGKMPLEEQGINILHYKSQVISADEIWVYGFIPFLLDFLKDYNYESYEISSKIACFSLRKNEDLRSLILEKFWIKQEKKKKKENYAGEKIMLNRIYGFFLTRGIKKPSHWGQYIVQKGKSILLNIIREIGLKDVVHSHTDSIKFVGNHEDVIERYNEKIEFEELGLFAEEAPMEKVVYYSVNKAKYLVNDELKFKHGGIEERDIEPLLKMGYDAVKKDTKYQLTIFYEYVQGRGLTSRTIEKEFGGSLNG